MDHKDLLKEVSQQLETILLESEQAIYIYLDDIHKVCNEKFSSLLGYNSPEEWSQVSDSFPSAFVANPSQRVLVETYQNAMQRKIGAQVNITWKKQDGG